jgi:hypothetical protein
MTRARGSFAFALALMVSACGGSGDGGGGGSGGSATGGSGGSSTGGTGGSATGGSAGSSTGGSAGASGCDKCQAGTECCNGVCANPMNDINNCGTCGNKCTGDHPFCDNGTCGTAPCDGTTCSGTTFCCNGSCCLEGQLCCVVPSGPVGPPSCTVPTAEGTCPVGCPACVCNSPDTPIATPSGERPIAQLREGDLVLSMQRGKVVAVPLRAVHHVSAPNHHVVEVRLETGTVLHISPKHPTADGRTFGTLKSGDYLDGVRIESAKLVPFQFDATWDILPSSDSGTYFAGGVLVGSTLSPPQPWLSSASSGRSVSP